MNHPEYSRDPYVDEIHKALTDKQKMTPEEMRSMPKIIERFRNEGLLKFPNSEMHRRAVSVPHRRKE